MASLKEKIKIIIKEFHEASLPELVERELEIDYDFFNARVNKIITVVGPRRAGKTFFSFQMMKRLLSGNGKITDILHINFEDERILPLRAEDLGIILEAYFELYDRERKPFLFFDEIQNIENWDKFVRRLNEQGYRIFITGSNSKFLSRDIATSLRGRTLTYELLPFSFSEILTAAGVFWTADDIYGKKRFRLKAEFDSYFESGGYPEIVFMQEDSMRVRMLQDYFNAIMFRDLVERYGIKNHELLRQWLHTLLSNISSMVSLSKVEKDYKSRGIKLSKTTLSEFTGYCEEIYFGFMLNICAESERRRQVNPKKFYIIDHGMHNYLNLQLSKNRGRVLENMVFLELRRRGYSLCYYKTKAGYEIDFLTERGEEKNLIQVCLNMDRIETYDREKRALVSGMRELGLRRGLIITGDAKREERADELRIEIIPAWEWFLSDEDAEGGDKSGFRQ